MIDDIRHLVASYSDWLRDKSSLREVDDHVEITTPYLDRHNDYIQLYVRRLDGQYLLTDGGYTLQDLRMSGCDLDSPKRQDLLRVTLNGLGVTNANGDLQVKATPRTFPLRKHNLIQAILAVNDLFYLSRAHISSLFLEDVTNWMIESSIRFVPRVKFTGKTGYDHSFDFAIPASRSRPERIVKAVATPTRDMAKLISFSWIDTRDVRPADSVAYAFLNDSGVSGLVPVIEALEAYGIKPVPWSARESAREDLAA
jgi:uncharacterized protein DUF1828/uncharacterized protein DUF1829